MCVLRALNYLPACSMKAGAIRRVLMSGNCTPWLASRLSAESEPHICVCVCACACSVLFTNMQRMQEPFGERP